MYVYIFVYTCIYIYVYIYIYINRRLPIQGLAPLWVGLCKGSQQGGTIKGNTSAATQQGCVLCACDLLIVLQQGYINLISYNPSL